MARRRSTPGRRRPTNDYTAEIVVQALRRRAKEAAIDRYRQDVQTFRAVAVEQLGCRSVVEMLDDVIRQIRGVFADPGEQGRSARPLPASSDDVETRHRKETALMKEIPCSSLASGIATQSVSSLYNRSPRSRHQPRPTLRRSADPLAIHAGQSPNHPDAPAAQPPEPEGALPGNGSVRIRCLPTRISRDARRMPSLSIHQKMLLPSIRSGLTRLGRGP